MKKVLQLGPFDTGWHWRFIVDGKIVAYGFDEDLEVARQQAKDAINIFRENEKK